jgi:uncharacterized protein YndB with AHSA1/START domain
MIEASADTVIEVPQAEVFDYIADPENHPTFTPSLMAVSNVEETDVGWRGEYTFKMVGTTTEGTFEDVEFDRPKVRSYELSGDIDGTVTWTLEDVPEGTRVHYDSEPDFPGPDFLETVTDPILQRFSDREVDSIVENLRDLLEERTVEA